MLQYPRSMMPEFFADHIGNLTVELVLAAVEISTLLIRVRPNLETLAVLQEAEAFPGNDAEGDNNNIYFKSYKLMILCFNNVLTSWSLTTRTRLLTHVSNTL
jgi:hypothetical protein